MNMTIEQTLQEAIEAHKVGNLHEAEVGYRVVLQIQPKHPDANHNLGVLAVSVNKLEEALLLFKTALEANPNQGQFWISYVDALIKVKQFDNAKSVLEQGKKKGLAGEKVDRLTQQLTHAVNKQGHESREEKKESLVAAPIQTKLTQKQGPSQADIDNFLKSLQKKDHHTAKKLATSITQKFPKHPLGWKMLGVALEQLGELSEAVIANQKAVVLAPEDPELHYNLSNRLREIGRLEDSVAGYRKATVLKPDYVEAHYNLGVTLQELGRLEEAEASYKNAIAIKPEYAEAHSNLGVTLQELGRLEEAEASYRKAIAIKPEYAEAYSNLGPTLQELGRLEEAETCYIKVISLKPDYEAAQYNLGTWYCEQGKYKQAAELFLKSKNFKNSQSNLLKCWYFLNEQSLFYEQLESLTSKGIADALIGSFGCRAEIKFSIEKANPFCSSPLNYLFKTDLSKKYDFEGKFVQPILSILNDKRAQNRSQNLLTNGFQTSGNLFSLENILIDDIKRIIELEIENFRLQFKYSKEGIIRNWPTSYSLYGWLIQMKSGGKLRPHIHENGWISGSIYINVPPKAKTDSGNLVVCIDDEEDPMGRKQNPKKIIDVVTGNIVLFPASLMHYTIPFESEEERIVLAFDVLPK